MRVVFVNRYFYPDHSATSQMVSDLAFHLASRGWSVGVITSRQRYDDPGARLPARETVRGVDVRRIWSSRFGRGFLPGRAIDYATFYVSAFAAIRGEKDATIVAMTDPPLLSVVAVLASRHVINWVQDLFPEVAGGLSIWTPKWVRRVRDWSLAAARKNVAIGDDMLKRVPNSVAIHNWAGAALTPVDTPHDRFVVGYSGNLGRAHDAKTMVGAMNRLRGENIELVVTGGGAKIEEVRRAALPNVRIEPYAPREQLSRSLSAADAHLVTLLPQLDGMIIPSKFYGILAVARPVLFVGAREGELARLIRQHDCGYAVECGDADGLAAAIRELAGDRGRARAMGARARALYDERFAPHIAFAAWEAVLGE